MFSVVGKYNFRQYDTFLRHEPLEVRRRMWEFFYEQTEHCTGVRRVVSIIEAEARLEHVRRVEENREKVKDRANLERGRV